MKPPLETVRISQRSRDILIKLKRKTGIEHWNVVCRWAFCASLSNSSKPVVSPSPDSNVEMSWKVFCGSMAEIFPALLLVRAQKDGVSTTNRDALAQYFRSHLERGISQLNGVKDLSALFASLPEA